MTAAISLYTGHTVHERREPFLHRFRYAIASILIDLDQLEDAGQRSVLFSNERFNLFSFFAKDHGARDGSCLRRWVDERLKDADIHDSISRVRLLCAPRVLGYVFNPLSIYFVEGQDDALIAVIYQVHNTFGDSHAYIARCHGAAREDHNAEKCFHVSPFFDINGRYTFTLRPPSDRFKLTIFKQLDGKPDLMATMSMHRREVTTGSLVSLFVRQPFSTLKTILAIHVEALKLWIKGARYHSRPQPGAAASLAQAGHEPTEFSGTNIKTP